MGDIDLGKPLSEYKKTVKRQLRYVYWLRYVAFGTFVSGQISFVYAVYMAVIST